MLRGRCTILKNIACRNHQLVKNFFILGLSSMEHSRLANINYHSHFVPSNSEAVPASMGFATNTGPRVTIVEYNEVKDIQNHPDRLLIDVREPNEVKQGKIPTAINIPIASVRIELALHTCSEVFQKRYGRPKPTIDTYIAFYCATGRRAAAIAEMIAELGYKNVHAYIGSWEDWVMRESQAKKC